MDPKDGVAAAVGGGDHQVEHENLCNYADRLGPYPSEAEASRALEKVKERNEEWDNDPKWNDKD